MDLIYIFSKKISDTRRELTSTKRLHAIVYCGSDHIYMQGVKCNNDTTATINETGWGSTEEAYVPILPVAMQEYGLIGLHWSYIS